MDTLTWSEVIAITYTSDDTEVTLTGEQLSVIVQMVALFNSPAAWSDYETYADDIDAMVAELTAILTGGL